MNELWSEKEINYCVRAYLWMRECEQAGEKVKKKVEQALIAGPLHQRGRLDSRMANISFVMRELGHDLLTGFKPQKNVAALSPNCHREAHYGNRKKEIRKFLLEKIAKIENA